MNRELCMLSSVAVETLLPHITLPILLERVSDIHEMLK